jgi:cell division protein FtsW (lipid II flippase)
MNRARPKSDHRPYPGRRDLLILAACILPALVLGVAWMRQTGVPAGVYMQNVAAAVAGAAIAAYGSRRHVSAPRGLAIMAAAILLLLMTLPTGGLQGVHRWIRVGPLNFHVAFLSIPLVLAELDRILRGTRLAAALCAMIIVTATLALQPDASQATAFAGSSVVLLAAHRKRSPTAIAGMLVLLVLAGLSFLKPDPLAPLPHVEEIAIRIAERGLAWQAIVFAVLTLLIAPFAVQSVTASKSAGLAVAVYLALVTAASYWGNFPVPVLGYGLSPILGYLAGWTWLRATRTDQTPCA